MVNSNQSSLNNAAKLASLNIILQILLRIGTFVANAALLRLVSSELLGIINVRLLLLYTTCQLLSREATRRACLSESKSTRWALIATCIWINVPISILIGSAVSWLWLGQLSLPSNALQSSYYFSVLAMPISVILELLSEPMYIYAQLNGFVKLRVFIDGITQTIRTFALVLVAFMTKSDSATLYTFGLTYISSAILYSSLYALYFVWHFSTTKGKPTVKQFLPDFSLVNDSQLKSLFKLTWSFFKQTILKQFLTEGERFVMTFLALLPLDQQGLFHVVGNVGALAARFIFAPVEEASYLHFSQLLHRSDSDVRLLQATSKEAGRILQLLMKAMTLIGLFGLAFGIPYSPTVLTAYGGSHLSSGAAVQLLRYQCAYIALIALNGILETFTFAAMSSRQLAQFNYALIAFSVLFLISSTPLVNFLALPGFVVASCLPMLGRIIFGWLIVQDYFNKCKQPNPLRHFVPNKLVLATLLVSSLTLMYFETNWIISTLKDHLVLIAIGSPMVLFSLLVVFWKETELVKFVRHDLSKTKTK